MERERQKEIITGFKPSRWIVSELWESPTSITFYPRVAMEQITLPCVGRLPKPKLFQVNEIEIEK